MPKPVPLAGLVVLAACASALLACTESASTTLNFVSNTSPTGTVTIDNLAGSVRLIASDSSKVEGVVHVHASGFDKQAQAAAAANGVHVVESGDANDLHLDVEPGGPTHDGTYDIDLDLTVPSGVGVSITTDDGSVTVSNLPVVTIETSNAPVTLSFTTGPVIVRTNDGPISIEGHQGDLDVRTVDSPIDLAAIQGNVRATTTNGAITARITPREAGEVTLATSYASIDLTLPTNFGADVTAITTGHGVVFVDGLPFSVDPGHPGEARGILGDGRGILDVRTNDADIDIHGR